jgi:pyridoxamine 5'-phosphate oxidase family protein
MMAIDTAVYERDGCRCDDRMGVMLFTEPELEFLRSQRIGRLASVGPSGWPHVVPVMYALSDSGAFEFDVDGLKLRNLTTQPRAAFVVDAMGPKRGVTVQGTAQLIGPARARLTGVHKFSWGL